jgi:hypothetical protein
MPEPFGNPLAERRGGKSRSYGNGEKTPIESGFCIVS